MKLNRRAFFQAAAAAGCAAWTGSASAQAKRPNILWLSCEDMSAHLGCYGDPHAITPVIDQLAKDGVRYTNVHTAAPVCAPNRSTMIAGIHAPRMGTHHMRSGGERGGDATRPPLPDSIVLLPEAMREAGYYCTNNVKEDYNFAPRPDAWDESSRDAHWRNRPDGAPFFAVFNFTGTHEGTVRLPKDEHEETVARLKPEERQDPAKITPPPFHPDTPVVREAWAQVYECVTALDYWVADRLREIDEAGLTDSTIVMFWSDHGDGLPRSKRWLYDSGAHVPLIVRFPEAMRPAHLSPGATDDRLVSSLDFAPTTLRLAGLTPPSAMQGKDFLAPRGTDEWDYLYGHRDRMDERYDCFRSVRDARYRYVRNFMYWQPYGQHLSFCELGPIMIELRRLQREGALPEGCGWVDAKTKPREELFDCQADPHNMRNLAGDPEHAETLARMRAALRERMLAVGDMGLIPEIELDRLGERHGTRYEAYDAIAKANPGWMAAIYDHAVADSIVEPGDAAADPVLRYWDAMHGVYSGSDAWIAAARTDASPAIALMASGIALSRGIDADAARAELEAGLHHKEKWVRLAAAHGIDGAGEAARPLVPAVKKAFADPTNQYVTRIATHTLNALGEPLPAAP